MSDLIRREDALKALLKLPCKIDSDNYTWIRLSDAFGTIEEDLPSAEPERRWIPFTMREVTAEEKEVYTEWDSILDCKLPDDGEEILVSNGKYVWLDTFINDCDGCYLDGGDDVEGLAWQPLPEPWRGE